MRTEEDGLPGTKVKNAVAKIDGDEPGAGSRGCDVSKRDRDDGHSAECYSSEPI